MTKKTIRPIWVNGIRHNEVSDAVKFTSLLCGKKIEAGWLLDQIDRYGRIKIHGILISTSGPKENTGTEAKVLKAEEQRKRNFSGGRLLYYPPGEEIVSRGLCRVRR
jgi:hypothetical protein